MDTTALKLELLHLIATDPAVRAALRETLASDPIIERRLVVAGSGSTADSPPLPVRAEASVPRSEAPPSAPPFTGPPWLAGKAMGPHSRRRFGGTV